MAHYDYLIVGSGLFGAIFAHEAAQKGKTCLVVEKRAHTGGNIYCRETAGINVHEYGAHIFHTSNRQVWDYVNRFAQFNRFTNSPIANYNGEIYNLPFNMNTFSRMWGVEKPDQARAVIEKQRAEIQGKPRNLEEQAISLVGRDVYEKLIKGYTQKQWGRECRELPAFIIKRIPVRFTYDNNYFNDLYQGIPIGGYNVIINRLLEGTEVRLHCDFFRDRAALSALADKIVYTGMVDAYFDHCYGHLEYRSLRFETQLLDQEDYQGVAVVNYTDAHTPFTRIIEHKHFEFGQQDKTVITREYPAEWQQGMEPYYPVNDERNQALYTQYKELADRQENVIFGGRLAEYKYYDMDKVIFSALQMCKKELG